MKKFFAVMIATMIAILTLSAAVAESTTTEEIDLIEANGYVVGIFLNNSDRKSAAEGGAKTELITKDMHLSKIKGSERYHGKPNAVVNWYSRTNLEAEVLYRNPETELDSLKEGGIRILRGLNSNRSRNDDLGEAEYLFTAYLDREGRKTDTVDYVFRVNKVIFSITHLRFSADDTRYYLVCGDARKGDPKTTTKKTTKDKDTDWTMQPVDPEGEDETPGDTDWTISGDDDQEEPGTDTDWTISGDTQEEPSTGTDTDWTITSGEEEPGSSSSEETPWTIGGGDSSSTPDEDTGFTIGGGSSTEDTGFTIGGGDTSDVSLLEDDWSIGGSSSDESSSSDTDWSI